MLIIPKVIIFIQSNPVNTDIEGAIESVQLACINGMSVTIKQVELRENVRIRDKENCLL